MPLTIRRKDYQPDAAWTIFGGETISTAPSSSTTSGQAQRDYIDYVRYMTYFHIGFAAPDKKLSVPLPRVNYYLRSPHPNT
jgi:hypothetical protein